MKDKRQRLAMTWPCDPAVYAYLVNAAHTAASYPYVASPAPPTHAVFPPAASAPFGYYSAGLQRVAAAAAAAASSPPYHHLLPVPTGVDAPYTAPVTAADHQRRAPVSRSPPTSSPTLTSHGDRKRPSHVTSMTSSSNTTPLFQPFKPDIQLD